MALKKLAVKIKKAEGGGGLKKIDMGALSKRREAAKALDFVGREQDVLADMSDDLKPEEENAERMRQLDEALNGEKPVTDGSTIFWRMTRATSLRTWSPASWPQVSLTLLNLSRSNTARDSGCCSPLARLNSASRIIPRPSST